MKTVQEIRKQFPQYDDLSDAELAEAIYSKFYSDMDRGDFNARIGLSESPSEPLRGGALEASAAGIHQGITFGLGDELTAAALSPIEATIDYFKGDGFDLGRGYERVLEDERARLQRAQEQHPGANIAGMLAGGAVTGGGLAKSGATLVGRTAGRPLATRAAAGGGEGAVYGGVYGFGTGEAGLDERAASAGKGALGGAVVGGSIPVAGTLATKALAPAARKIGSMINPTGAKQQAGVDRVLQDARQAGLTKDDLIQGVQQGRTIGQQDPLLSDLTRSVKRQPGGARKTITDALDQGYAANNRKALDDTVSGLGGERNFYVWRDMFAKSKSKGAQKAYDAAFKANWGKDGPPFALDGLMKRIPAEALRSAQRIAQAEGRAFGKQLVANIDDASGTVQLSRLPSLEEAELIRRGLSSATSKAFRAGDGSVGAAYRSLEKEMRSILDEFSPMLRQTRKAYATASQIQEAADEGLTLLNKSADEVEYIVGSMSKVEKEAARKGLASALKDRVERGQINRDAVRNIFGSERNRRILAELWPDEKSFAQFRRQMENRAEFSAFRQNVQGNSRTQQDLADAGSLGGGVMNVGRRLVTGDLRGAMFEAVQSIAGRFVNPAKGLPPEQLQRMAEILVETNPKQAQALLSRVSQGDRLAHDALVKAVQKLLDNPALQQPAISGILAAQ